MTEFLPILDEFDEPEIDGDDDDLDAPEIGDRAMENRDRSALARPEAPTLTRTAQRRRLIELTKQTAAAEQIGRLPEPGEDLHIRMAGDWDGFDLVPALLTLAAPATIDHLHIATLSFNRRVSDRLIRLIDEGQVHRVTFLSSAMFAGKEASVVDSLTTALAERGSRLAVARNHSKLLLTALSDGRCLTVEGSLNLRRCSCYEQLMISADRELYDWHANFIERLVKDGDRA